MSKRTHIVACLAGNGVGPELMAEASRALAEVSALHGFRIEEMHVPFGGEGLSGYGHRLPAATRAASRGADAVLVASAKEPALPGVRAGLELCATVARVRSASADLAVVSPLGELHKEWAVELAFALARTRRGRVTALGADHRWRELVERVGERHPAMEVVHTSPAAALPGLSAGGAGFDVIVTEEVFAEAVLQIATLAPEGRRAVAVGQIAERGPGLFGPVHGPAFEIAGQGVANPTGVLLAAALMLDEGLGERAAARTLADGVAEAFRGGARTPDMHGTGAADTRSFMDAVLVQLPRTRTGDTEFGLGVVA
ncbi:MAG: isocitrate/isopropylmalate family dehydrogenase [Gaiellaceae bacterium]